MSAQRKRFYKRPVFLIPAAVVAIPAVAFAWWLWSPLFLNKTVIEPFPTPAAAPAPAAQIVAEGGPADTSVTDADGAAPPPEIIEVELDEPTPTTITPTTTPTTAPTTTTPSTTQSPGAVALLAGSFKDADSRHKGSGDATVYELADGSRVLRLENLDVTNGPDLHVFLAPVADASERADVMAEGYLDLGGSRATGAIRTTRSSESSTSRGSGRASSIACRSTSSSARRLSLESPLGRRPGQCCFSTPDSRFSTLAP